MKNRIKYLEDNNYFYNPRIKYRGVALRKRYTKAEKRIWEKLLIARKMQGFRFMRQVPVLYYITDFMCKELALIIEIDGPIHKFRKKTDEKRQHRLESCGFYVLRFTNEQVNKDIDKVEEVLNNWIDNFMNSK